MPLELNKDEKYLFILGGIFAALIVLFLIVSFGSGHKEKSKVYEIPSGTQVNVNVKVENDGEIVSKVVKENVTLETSPVTTTSVQQKKAIRIICLHADDNNDCDSLKKFDIRKEECCQYGLCCED